MALQKIKSIFLLIFISFISISYASIQDTIDIIFQHAQSSIERIESRKIFFRSEKVSLYNGKIYLQGEEDEAISIPCIFTHESGLYLPIKNEVVQFWICTTPWCQWVYYDEPQRCSNCHNTRFNIRYKSKL